MMAIAHSLTLFSLFSLFSQGVRCNRRGGEANA